MNETGVPQKSSNETGVVWPKKNVSKKMYLNMFFSTVLKIRFRKIAQIDKLYKNVGFLVVLAKLRFDWTKTHRTSKIVLFFVRNDPKSETKSSRSSKIIKICRFSPLKRVCRKTPKRSDLSIHSYMSIHHAWSTHCGGIVTLKCQNAPRLLLIR